MESKRIYFLVDIRTSFEERILRGIARFTRSQHPRWRVTWGSKLDAGLVRENDGIVLFAKDPEELKAVRSLGLPIVATSTRHLKDGFPCVVTGDQAIGEMAAMHFREKFYRSFAYLGPRELSFGLIRERAFARALAPEPVRVLELNSEVELETRLRELKEDLERLPPHTAVFCANDVFARMVLNALQASSRKVPGDLAVLGVDADELVGLSCSVDLSSIDSAPEEIGFQAAELLKRILEHPGSVPPDTVIRVPPVGVVEGASTDALASSDERILRAGMLLRQHACDRNYGIDELARACGCSRRTLELRFSEVTGQGINAHIWKLRMDRAKELLRTSNLPLGEVAEQCGFASPYHFSQKFKRDLGLTPGAFRQKKDST
ncbi:MAG: substrate-binding domain-containing protein [Verrucomicrobia bacterium]|nr:substrate-binding domain-containing protein [Verrucomicrobiota bacterium]MCH8526750.1 substrate-binding domain-containing protein [Kiritimatiellia bacterium]